MVMPMGIQREVLTGRVRGRISRWTQKVVMQVEVNVQQTSMANRIDRPSEWLTVATLWRDVTWRDHANFTVIGVRPE